jgi:hypothetical protein
MWVLTIAPLAALMIGLALYSRKQWRSLPPYRAVVERHDELDGEHVTLECGHRLLLRHHRRAALPCEECQETHKC